MAVKLLQPCQIDLQEDAYMILSRSIETNYFHVFYDESDCNIIEQIVTLIDDVYDHTVKRFELKTDYPKYRFMLCPSREVFRKLTGKSDDEYEDWMVGHENYENRTLCILSPNIVDDRTFDDMLAVVKHEIIHIAFDQIQNENEANIMIAEGIAVACAGQIDRDRLDDRNYPDVRKLLSEEYFYENEGYLYSGVYVLHLLKQVGIDCFKRIYAGEEAIEKYLYDGFERDAIQGLVS